MKLTVLVHVLTVSQVFVTYTQVKCALLLTDVQTIQCDERKKRSGLVLCTLQRVCSDH